MYVLKINHDRDFLNPYKGVDKEWEVCGFTNRMEADAAQLLLTAIMMVDNFDKFVRVLQVFGIPEVTTRFYGNGSCRGFGCYIVEIEDGSNILSFLNDMFS